MTEQSDPLTDGGQSADASTGDEHREDETDGPDPTTEEGSDPVTEGESDPETEEATDGTPTDEEIRILADRLSERTVPIGTTDPDADPDDLAPLADRFADARVVGLGEATHGTREFFQAKHRLIRFLVERLDYRLVALEANFSETLAIDEYVVHGRGDPRDALDGIYFWTWDTEEVLALIEWLRAFNEGRPLDDRVRFYGIDAQFTAGPAAALVDFLEEYAPDVLADHEDTLAMLADEGLAEFAMSEDDFDSEDEGDEEAADRDSIDEDSTDGDDDTVDPAARLDAVETLVEELGAWFDDGHAVEAGADPETAAVHRRHLTVLDQVLTDKRAYLADDTETQLCARDRAMARNLSWVLDHESHDQVAVWAHDEHLQVGTREHDWGTWVPMGTHLDEWDDEYYAVGFDFAGGEFQARVPTDEGFDLQACSLDPPREDAATRLFAATEGAPWVLDFDAATDDDRLAAYFDAERPTRSVGALYDPDGAFGDVHQHYRLPEAFDGLLFVAETSRARPIERECPAATPARPISRAPTGPEPRFVTPFRSARPTRRRRFRPRWRPHRRV